MEGEFGIKSEFSVFSEVASRTVCDDEESVAFIVIGACTLKAASEGLPSGPKIISELEYLSMVLQPSEECQSRPESSCPKSSTSPLPPHAPPATEPWQRIKKHLCTGSSNRDKQTALIFSKEGVEFTDYGLVDASIPILTMEQGYDCDCLAALGKIEERLEDWKGVSTPKVVTVSIYSYTRDV